MNNVTRKFEEYTVSFKLKNSLNPNRWEKILAQSARDAENTIFAQYGDNCDNLEIVSVELTKVLEQGWYCS